MTTLSRRNEGLYNFNCMNKVSYIYTQYIEANVFTFEYNHTKPARAVDPRLYRLMATSMFAAGDAKRAKAESELPDAKRHKRYPMPRHWAR